MMGGMRGLSVLLIVAACSSPPGLTLEVVVDDPAIERVELFVGEHCSGDCPDGIVPPDLPTMSVTNAYVVTDAVPWSVSDGNFGDGVAGFRLESPHDTSVAILVVVGYDAQDQIRWSSTFHDVAVPSNDAVYWQVRLAPTTPITAPVAPQPAGTERIKHWQQPSRRLPSCLLLEHWTGDDHPTRDLVVPDADRDCDELPEANECAPWTPNAVRVPPTLDDASCLLAGPLPSLDAQVCLIGGPECTEDPNEPRDECVAVAEPYCVSNLLCECIGVDDFGACVQPIVLDGVTKGLMPSLTCTLQIDAEGRLCDHEPIELDFGPFLLSSSTKCSAIRLNDWAPPLGAFATKLHIDNSSKLEVVHFDKPCKAELELEGETTPQELLAAVEIELDNGNHLVVPAQFKLSANGCDGTSRCGVFVPTTSDSIWQCVEPRALACAPEPNSQCDGPMCNGICCGKGEMCTPNGCSCAGGDRCRELGDTCQSEVAMPDQCGTVCCGETTPCPFQ